MTSLEVVFRAYEGCLLRHYIVFDGTKIFELTSDELRKGIADGEFECTNLVHSNGFIRTIVPKMSLEGKSYVETFYSQLSCNLKPLGYIGTLATSGITHTRKLARVSFYNPKLGAVVIVTIYGGGLFFLQFSKFGEKLFIFTPEGAVPQGVVFEPVPKDAVLFAKQCEYRIKSYEYNVLGVKR